MNYKLLSFSKLIELIKEIILLLGVQFCFRRFFSEIRGFIVKNCYTFMIQSIVHCCLLLSPIFRVAYESRVEKTGHLLRLSTNQSNFLLL